MQTSGPSWQISKDRHRVERAPLICAAFQQDLAIQRNENLRAQSFRFQRVKTRPKGMVRRRVKRTQIQG